jgi:hypothetical protein
LANPANVLLIYFFRYLTTNNQSGILLFSASTCVKYKPVLNATSHRNTEIKVSFIHTAKIQATIILPMTTQEVQENKTDYVD